VERFYDGLESKWDAFLARVFGEAREQSVLFGRLQALPFIVFSMIVVLFWCFLSVQIMNALPESVDSGLAMAVFLFFFVMGTFAILAFFIARGAVRHAHPQKATSN
jgi:hypothetical protein